MTPVHALPDVIRITSLARSNILRGVQAGTFLKPIQLSPRRIGWLEADLQAWLDAKREEGRPVC